MNKVKLYIIKKLLSSLYLKDFNKEIHSFSKLEELIQDDIHFLLIEELKSKNKIEQKVLNSLVKKEIK